LSRFSEALFRRGQVPTFLCEVEAQHKLPGDEQLAQNQAWLNILIQQLDTGTVEHHSQNQASKDRAQPTSELQEHLPVQLGDFLSYHSCKRQRSGHW
jgi:hypothetical protein